MKKYIIAFYLVGMSGGLVSAQDYVSKVWVSDQGDGTYKNPVLYADYSDPDACRVGDDYYLTSSSFGCLPGLQILHSKDLVNCVCCTTSLKEEYFLEQLALNY